MHHAFMKVLRRSLHLLEANWTKILSRHGRRQRGAGRAVVPWIFIHVTNTVDKGLKMLFFGVFLLFFGLFSVAPPPGRGLIVLFSVFFGIFRSFFPLPPLWKFFCWCPCQPLKHFKNFVRSYRVLDPNIHGHWRRQWGARGICSTSRFSHMLPLMYF